MKKSYSSTMNKRVEDDLLALLRQRFPDVQGIYLFGSQRPGGGATCDSDTDVGLLLPAGDQTSAQSLWEASSACADVTKTPVDLVSLRQATTVMQHQIINDGVCLFRDDTVAASVFEIYVDKEKNSLDEARAALMDDVSKRGFIYER